MATRPGAIVVDPPGPRAAPPRAGAGVWYTVYSMLESQAARPNLSQALAASVREAIVAGRLPPGRRINEVHLAAELGVSRTPLREALTRLAGEGALGSQPRSGFFVQPLTRAEFEQIYPLRALLDPEALRLAGLPPPARLAALEALNRRIEGARKAEDALALDDAWHRELLAACPNRELLGLIEHFTWRTRRYEMALMRERRNVKRAARDHRAILTALRARDLPRACAALKANMESGREPLLAWLQERSAR